MSTYRPIETPEYGPAVAFHRDIGKYVPKGMVIELDEADFRALCAEQEPDVLNAGDRLGVYIRPDLHGGGVYYSNQRQIDVRYRGSLRRTNFAIRHELRHHADNIRGTTYNRTYYEFVQKAARYCSYPTIATACVDLGMITCERFVENAPDWLSGASWAGMGAFALGAVGCIAYAVHPLERRANKAAFNMRQLNPLRLVPQAAYDTIARE